MVSIDKFEQHSTEVYQDSLVSKCLYQFAGLSTDTKPTVTFNGSLIMNGSVFFAMDTATAYMYDEQNSTWREL